MNQEQIIHENKLYNEINTDLFTTYQEVETFSTESITPVFKGAKIPRHMWKNILAFMKQSYDQFKSETLVYLFYDEKSKTPWDWWVPTQETAGMTVESSPEDPKYQEQRKLYSDTMFGTVHHHCSTSAFQSGTDEADEVNREGIHFTIGHMDNEEGFDIHCRITIGGCHAEIDAGTYIEQAGDPFKKTADIPDEMKQEIAKFLHTKDIVNLNPDYKKTPFTQMSNVTKRTYTTRTYKNKYPTQLGWNYGNYESSANWYDHNKSKKNQTEEMVECASDSELTGHDALADELVNLIQTDYEYEDILIQYYDYIGNNTSSCELYTGKMQNTRIAKDLKALYNNNKFLSSEKGKEVLILTKDFLLDWAKDNGLDTTINDLKYGLGELQYYEDGEGVQSMATEDVL